MSVSLPCVRQTVHYSFSRFCLHPGHRKSLEDKTYPAMNLPVHEEPNGVSCILVDDCTRKL